MSAFGELASPAPRVGAATAERAMDSGAVRVEPAIPCEEAIVEPARQVEPAVTVDDPKQFAPAQALKKAEISHLSVTALRTSGSDFEGMAGVLSGPPRKNFFRRVLPLLFDERDFVAMGEVARYVFVKGDCILVYGQETDPSPLYAVPLENFRAIQEDPKKPDRDSFTISPRANTNEARVNLVTILLKYNDSGKQAYQFTFDTTADRSIAKRFMDVIASKTGAKTARCDVLTAMTNEDLDWDKSTTATKLQHK